MTYKGLIFDFNGVLWWDSYLQEKSWKEYSVKLRGHPLSDEEMSVHVHGRNNQYTLSYLIGYEVKGDELYNLTQGKESKYRELCLAEGDNFKLSPGAIELLDFLKERKINRNIATASEKTNLDFFVERLQLSRWFDIKKIVYDDGSLPGKPAPDLYLRASYNIGLLPKDCIVIEDARSGIESASRAGIGHIIALGPKERHPQLNKLTGVSEVVTNLGEVSHTLFI